MVKKIMLCSAISLIASAAEDNKKLDRKQKVNKLVSPTQPEQTEPAILDMVTPIKPLQQLIIGYMGAFEYGEDESKKVASPNQAHYRDPEFNEKIEKMFSWRASRNLRNCFSSTTERMYYASSVTEKLFAETVSGVRPDGTQTTTVTVSENNVAKSPRLAHIEICAWPSNVYALALSPAGDRFVTLTAPDGPAKCDTHAIMQVWDIQTGTCIYTDSSTIPLLIFRLLGAGVRYSPDGNYIAYNKDTSINIIDAHNFNVVSRISELEPALFEYSLDGNYIAHGVGNLIRFFQKKLNNALLK